MRNNKGKRNFADKDNRFSSERKITKPKSRDYDSESPKSFDKPIRNFSKVNKPSFDRKLNTDFDKTQSEKKISKPTSFRQKPNSSSEKSFSRFFDESNSNENRDSKKPREFKPSEKKNYFPKSPNTKFNSDSRFDKRIDNRRKDDTEKFDEKFDYDNYKGFSGDKFTPKKSAQFGERRTPNNNAKFYKPKPQPDNILSKQHNDGLVRLNKYISNAGICSRREADELIKSGVIKVNGKIVSDLGVRINPTDIVLMEGQRISQEKKVYILLNKPKDFITTADDPEDRKTVMNLVKDACRERVYPVGRLDRNTTGVLLMTNDGELTKKLTHPRYEKSKMYHVFLDKPLTKIDFETIEKGVELEDGFIKVDAIDYVAKATNFDEIGIELHSGKNRVVRRIFEGLGYRVLKLDRVMFAGLTKKDLSRGRWRFLTSAEVNMLYAN